ncbi:transcriptional protein SWT1 [Linepithema humile]|uniref:transcriptional protein SWT1 n=1 Tax=Linepithema humile TaxID=83485 RepID=UPI00062362E8|nr:PREDICTED: transcriptional protein SWT1 [Linepithema humile]
MIKHKLPQDWIIVSSKSHPDRIYYFNVKTNKSTWVQPSTIEIDKTLSVNGNHKNLEGKFSSRAKTPERDLVNDETSHRQTQNKIVRTPQRKDVRETGHQRSIAKNKPPSKSSYTKSRNDKRMSSFVKSSSAKQTNNNISMTSLHKDNIKTTTFTPQMCVLRDKIQLRNSGTSNLNQKTKISVESKQQTNISNKMSIKMQERKGEQRNIYRFKNGTGQYRNNQKKGAYTPQDISKQRHSLKNNLATERMQTLRRSLNLEKEKFEEICRSVGANKIPSRRNRSLPNSHNNDGSESSYAYRNVEVRLKRLHNRVLKDSLYKNNVASNNDKQNKSQTLQDKTPVDITTDELIKQANKEVLDYEEMDWEPMNDEEITLQVEVVRAQLNKESADDINHIPGNTVELMQFSGVEESQEKGPLHIVVDTNVFLVNLEIIEEARDTVFKHYPRPFIIIPWTVICELDYFKENKSKWELRAKARKAISFIHEQFSAKHPRVIGQTREQAAQNKEDFSLNCPDDEILQCCLQIQKLGKSVVLLSYDKNLCTKTMVYNILALGRNDPLEKINYINMDDRATNYLTNGPNETSLFTEESLLTDNVFEDTKTLMKDFLSTIIVKQMAEIYGELEWKIYVIIKPPWTIITALKCAVKHWIAAINESFQRHAESNMKDLLHAFENTPTGGRKLQDVECILEKCSNLVQMVNTTKHCELMTQTFDAITELKSRCRKYITDMDQKKLYAKIGAVENIQEQEMRAERVFQSFQYIYNYARDICGLACSVAGIPCSFNYRPLNPPMSQTAIQHLQPEITKKINDLTQNLNKLLMQAENSIKYETLLSLQHNLNTFLPDAQRMTVDVEILDIYYCVQLKKNILQNGLRQLQELSTHFCALANHA